MILFGEPGNGKSLFIKEIIRCCNTPVFIFRGEKQNVVESIVEIFQKAREVSRAIIVFDELDLLINNEKRVVKALQENLDGVESNDDILVLAATNDIDEIPNALMRNGRLEKLIHIPDPSGEEALELLKKHFSEFNLELPVDFDEEETALALNNITFAGVKSVVNDLVLRNGFENITSEMIENSINNITDRVKKAPKKNNYNTAIHEAGHALMAYSFSQFFTINKLTISGVSGHLSVKEVEKDFWPYKKMIADIKISMAGTIAQKVICGEASWGVKDDLQSVRTGAYRLVNLSGYSSCWETLPYSSIEFGDISAIKRRRMERKAEKILKKCEKETIKYIKANQQKIIALTNLLMVKNKLKSSEVIACIEQDFKNNDVSINKDGFDKMVLTEELC